MAFRKEPRLELPKGPDLNALAQEIQKEQQQQNEIPEFLKYAPRDVRDNHAKAVEESLIQRIEKYSEQPVKEIDEVIKSAREALAECMAAVDALEKKGAAVKQMFAGHASGVLSRVHRLTKGIEHSMSAFDVLREQCIALDNPEVKKETE